MAAHPVHSSLSFPGLAASARPQNPSRPQSSPCLPSDGLGALRGLAFAALFELLIAFAGFELWRLLR